MPGVELHLRFRTKDPSGESLRAFLREAVPIYQSPGGIRVRLLRDRSDGAAFIEVIEYDTTADFDRDQLRVEHDPVMIELLGRWRSLLDGPPVVEVYAADDPHG